MQKVGGRVWLRGTPVVKSKRKGAASGLDVEETGELYCINYQPLISCVVVGGGS